MEVDRSKFRQTVLLPFSGQEVVIRRVRQKEFIEQIGGLALPMNLTVQEALEQLRDKISEKIDKDPDLENKIQRFYISRGAVEPKVWLGPVEECPADSIPFDDLGGDADHLAAAIVTYSNEVSSLKSMEKFFRESGATRAPAPDGEDVRTEAEQPTA